MRRQKERFLMFTRVLMKYLETKDPALHQKVKAIIKDCAERNKRGEPGYESVTASMRSRLKRVVSESYWSRAEVSCGLWDIAKIHCLLYLPTRWIQFHNNF